MSITPNPANLLMHFLVNATMGAIPVTCPPNLGQSGFVEGKKEPGVNPLPAFGGIPRIVGLVPPWQFSQDHITGNYFVWLPFLAKRGWAEHT